MDEWIWVFFFFLGLFWFGLAWLTTLPTRLIQVKRGKETQKKNNSAVKIGVIRQLKKEEDLGQFLSGCL